MSFSPADSQETSRISRQSTGGVNISTEPDVRNMHSNEVSDTFSILTERSTKNTMKLVSSKGYQFGFRKVNENFRKFTMYREKKCKT